MLLNLIIWCMAIGSTMTARDPVSMRRVRDLAVAIGVVGTSMKILASRDLLTNAQTAPRRLAVAV
jgi:hypothetical protein